MCLYICTIANDQKPRKEKGGSKRGRKRKPGEREKKKERARNNNNNNNEDMYTICRKVFSDYPNHRNASTSFISIHFFLPAASIPNSIHFLGQATNAANTGAHRTIRRTRCEASASIPMQRNARRYVRTVPRLEGSTTESRQKKSKKTKATRGTSSILRHIYSV